MLEGCFYLAAILQGRLFVSLTYVYTCWDSGVYVGPDMQHGSACLGWKGSGATDGPDGPRDLGRGPVGLFFTPFGVCTCSGGGESVPARLPAQVDYVDFD